MTMLDRKNISRGRAPLSVEADAGAPHQKAFDAYIRHGDDDALRGLPLEGKAMSTVSDGGFLAAPTVALQVQDALNVTASLRRVANIVTVESANYEVLVDMGDIASGWSTEATAQAETGTSTVQRVVIPVHELSAMPKASQRLLDDAAFDIETWLAGRIAEKFARAEATAFVSGDGVNKPKGFLTHAKAPNGTATNVQIGTIASGGDGDFATTNPANALIDLVYALDASYRANATFVMNSKTAGAVRKMKDADGRFLIAFDRDAPPPAKLSARLSDGRVVDRALTVAPREGDLVEAGLALSVKDRRWLIGGVGVKGAAGAAAVGAARWRTVRHLGLERSLSSSH